MTNDPFAGLVQKQQEYFLFAFTLPGDLVLPRVELVRRGIPDDLLVNRTTAQALRLAFSQDNKTKWVFTGSRSMYRLHDPSGFQAAYLRIENETVNVEWLAEWMNYTHPDLSREEVVERITKPWEDFIQSRVQFHLLNVDRPNIHRALDRWLDQANARQEIIPGLRRVPVSEGGLIRAIIQALPEAEFRVWRVSE